MYYIGLDVGTSSLKTTVIDEHKEIVYESTIGYSIEEPRLGYREIDPKVWFDSVIQSLKSVFEQFEAQYVSTIGVTGQMHTTVFLDEQGQPVCNAIMWTDVRSTDMIPKLKKELAQIQETKYISKIISTGCPAVNTLWLKENQPDVFKKIRKIMTPYDYIVYCLCGNMSLDYCDASTSSVYDIQTKQWSDYMLKKLSIDESYFGKVHASCDVIGTLKKEICDMFGISSMIKIIAGTGDNPASAVAMNILHQTNPVISLGTSGVVIIPKKDGDFEGKGKNVLFKAKNSDCVNIVQGTVRQAGGTHKWWIENIIQTNDMTVDQDKISQNNYGKNSILFFPHITGDKLIYQDMGARGSFIGLDASHTRKDMTQAVFEGVSFAIKEVLENMNLDTWPTHIQINGGGTKSTVWMSIMASILNVELEVVSMQATPGYGACLLAYLSEHEEKEIQIEVSGKKYLPISECVQEYEKAYQKYKLIYPALKRITDIVIS